MSSIIKNNTASSIVYDIGFTVPASGQLLIDPSNKKLFARSNEVNADLVNSVTTLNDGTTDLDVYEAIWHLNDIFPNISGIVGPQGNAGSNGSQGIQGIQGPIGPIGVQGPIGNDGPIGPTGPAGSGGGLEEYQYAESLGTTTSSNSFIEKLKLTTTSLAGGFYRFNWSYEHEVNDNNRRLEIRCQLDDTIEIFNLDSEIRDDRFFAAAGFRRLNLSAGIHFFDLDFRRDNSHGSIRNATFDIWKVG